MTMRRRSAPSSWWRAHCSRITDESDLARSASVEWRGKVRSFGPSYVHNLVNPGPGLATSIHAYSPPISMLNYYAVLPGGVERVRSLMVEHPEPPAPGGWLQAAPLTEDFTA